MGIAPTLFVNCRAACRFFILAIVFFELFWYGFCVRICSIIALWWSQFFGHADISLSDAYNYMAYPVTSDSMNLVTVLDHPVLSPMWDAHVQKELSSENTAFYRVTRAFQAWAIGRKRAVMSSCGLSSGWL